MTWMEWYNSLVKPSWTPAPSTISLIWTILYPIILVSFGFVFVQALRGKVGWRVAMPLAINLVANLLFMPIFAGLRNVPLACVDILIVWATIICCVVITWPISKIWLSPGGKSFAASRKASTSSTAMGCVGVVSHRGQIITDRFA